MKPDLERGELQYQPFTVWERIKRIRRIYLKRRAERFAIRWYERYGRK